MPYLGCARADTIRARRIRSSRRYLENAPFDVDQDDDQAKRTDAGFPLPAARACAACEPRRQPPARRRRRRPAAASTGASSRSGSTSRSAAGSSRRSPTSTASARRPRRRKRGKRGHADHGQAAAAGRLHAEDRRDALEQEADDQRAALPRLQEGPAADDGARPARAAADLVAHVVAEHQHQERVRHHDVRERAVAARARRAPAAGRCRPTRSPTPPTSPPSGAPSARSGTGTAAPRAARACTRGRAGARASPATRARCPRARRSGAATYAPNDRHQQQRHAELHERRVVQPDAVEQLRERRVRRLAELDVAVAAVVDLERVGPPGQVRQRTSARRTRRRTAAATRSPRSRHVSQARNGAKTIDTPLSTPIAVAAAQPATVPPELERPAAARRAAGTAIVLSSDVAVHDPSTSGLNA